MKANTKRKFEKGSAFITIFFFMTLVGLAASSMGIMLQGDMHLSRRVVDRLQAYEIARGAAERGLAYIVDNIENISTPCREMQEGTLGSGTYKVYIEKFGGGDFGLVAEATVGDVVQKVKVYGRYPDEKEAFMRGVFSNGDLIGHGNGTVENGTHSNQNSDFFGSINIEGNASSSGSTSMRGAANATGTVSSGAPRITFPELDWNHYYDIAAANGEVYVGDQTLKGTYNPSGGVMYVVGNVDTTSAIVNGMVICTGTFEDHGKTVIKAPQGEPAIAARNGHVDFHGKSAVEGLVYTGGGDVYMHGNTQITGSVIVWGTYDSYGNWGQLDYMETDPELTSSSTIKVLVWEL